MQDQLAIVPKVIGSDASVTPVTGWNSQLTVLSTPKEGTPSSVRTRVNYSAIILSSRGCMMTLVGGCFRPCCECLISARCLCASVAVLDHAELCLMAYESVIGGCFRSCSECLMADESVIGGCFISYCECLTTDESVIGGCFRSCCEYLMSA